MELWSDSAGITCCVLMCPGSESSVSIPTYPLFSVPLGLLIATFLALGPGCRLVLTPSPIFFSSLVEVRMSKPLELEKARLELHEEHTGSTTSW